MRGQDSTPLRGVTLAADASWRPGRASHHTTTRRWHFVSSALVVLIAPLRQVVSLQLERGTAAIALRDSRTEEIKQSRIREANEMTQARSGAETISKRTGEIMSSRSIRPIGNAIGTGIATISGMATVAVLSTARGSSSISDSRGTHTV